jgi:hypothetical protein
LGTNGVVYRYDTNGMYFNKTFISCVVKRLKESE